MELGGYQVALEEVLTWLLEAEDKLNDSSVTEGALESVKEQFHSHEVTTAGLIAYKHCSFSWQ